MPQIGPMELLVVAVIALIVFGPRRLPEIARSVGKAFSEFKRQATEVRSEFESSLSAEELEPVDLDAIEDEVSVPPPGHEGGTPSTPAALDESSPPPDRPESGSSPEDGDEAPPGR